MNVSDNKIVPASKIAQDYDTGDVSVLGLNLDEFTKSISQAKALAMLLSDKEYIDTQTADTYENSFWVLLDHLDSLKDALIWPNDASRSHKQAQGAV